MTETNLVKSETLIAKVLQPAIENGLSHWTLEFADLGLDASYATFFFPALEWLEAEGLIRVGEYARTMGGLANGAAINVHLTSYGMHLLGKTITVGDRKVTLQEEVRRMSAGERSFSSLGDFVGGLLGGFTKSMGA